MSAGEVGSAIETYGKVQTPSTVTLPGSGGTPVEISISGDECQVSLSSATAYKWTIADSATNAAANFSGDDFANVPADGVFNLGVAGYGQNNAMNLYVLAQGATGGQISFWKHNN